MKGQNLQGSLHGTSHATSADASLSVSAVHGLAAEIDAPSEVQQQQGRHMQMQTEVESVIDKPASAMSSVAAMRESPVESATDPVIGSHSLVDTSDA